MKDYEKDELPHCLYRLFAADGALLYVGCSKDPFSRIAAHGNGQPWRFDMVRATFEWFPDAIRARRAEAEAVLSEAPRHNRLVVQPDAVFMARTEDAMRKRQRRDGACPKCGNPIEDKRPGKAYCNSCFAAYRRERRLRAVAQKEPTP